ncbi:hypothetical protein [Streptomyces jumonjinensis]|uniref:hypothetical protein n=1 Tax=Streptomyces jumonjinensis TaxID=1945 RepID=UPI0012974F73|nr:hypothetical protein [Streptomyces jumonjinensis]
MRLPVPVINRGSGRGAARPTRRHDVAIHGLVCHGREPARSTDPAFYDAVAQDMGTSGVPLLGDGFVAAYTATAQNILAVLPGNRPTVSAPPG